MTMLSDVNVLATLGITLYRERPRAHQTIALDSLEGRQDSPYLIMLCQRPTSIKAYTLLDNILYAMGWHRSQCQLAICHHQSHVGKIYEVSELCNETKCAALVFSAGNDVPVCHYFMRAAIPYVLLPDLDSILGQAQLKKTVHQQLIALSDQLVAPGHDAND